jgi:hypothetical protein
MQDHPPPNVSGDESEDLKHFMLEVTRQHAAYLKHVESCGYTIDKEALARFEAEIRAGEASVGGLAEHAMLDERDLDELQLALAWADSRERPSEGSATKVLVAQRDHVKLRMRREANHALPHFHLEHKTLYSATYQIDPLQRLAGEMPRAYEEKLWQWIIDNQSKLLAKWDALNTGKDVVIERGKVKRS